MAFQAVIFDLGGVVFPSPFDAFTAYDREHGLPDRFIRGVVAASADHGAWARLERSEVSFDEFCTAFARECADAGGEVDAAELMRSINQGFAARPAMMQAIAAIRAHGLKVGALTNNWAHTGGDGDQEPHAMGHLGAFDVVVESAVEGLRKPDPRIYELACARLDVTPDQAVFLDDLGVNLKPARALGMTTIKVEDPDVALAELASVLGFALDSGLMELVLVRHAEPVRIGPEESGGQAVDPQLTERGLDQAARLATWLAGEPVHHVVSSPLRRALETAAPVAAAHGLAVETLDGLQEWDAASDHYIPMEELRENKDDRWQAMVEGRWEDYGGENPERFRARIVPTLNAVIEAHPGETVVVSCHGGVINVYLAALLGLTHHLWFDPGYTSISRVRAARSGARSLASLNETAHLYTTREGTP